MSDDAILVGPKVAPHSGGPAKKLVVLLHGVGADGNDLIALATPLAPYLPEVEFIAPDAPQACDMAPFGRQWFSLQDWTPAAMLAGIQASAPALNAFLDAELEKRGLNESDLALVGFSQGTMMSLYVAPRRAQPCAGVVGFSGALMGSDLLANEIVSRPPMVLVHGEADEMVDPAALPAAHNTLAAAGIEVSAYMVPGLGHSIDPNGLGICVQFLAERLGFPLPTGD